MNSIFFIATILIVLVSVTLSFNIPGYKLTTRYAKLSMSSQEDDSASFVPPSAEDQPDKKLFDMNRRVRLGRSRDQDGKSNIWSIEPTMEVVDEESGGGVKKNLLIGGLVIGAAVAALPLFAAFSKLFPDPADF